MSAAVKHTPGPWKVFTTRDGNRVIGIGDVNAEGVADCGFGVWRGGDAEALANARLMAAAPDLLDALNELLKIRSGRTVKAARAAIAKATGAA